jgi:hypothetical protein
MGHPATEEGLALVTTEGDEVKLFGLLEAFQALWHGGRSSLHPTLRKGREGWGTRHPASKFPSAYFSSLLVANSLSIGTRRDTDQHQCIRA